MKGKALSSGERKITFNVFNYFKTENPSLKRNALVKVESLQLNDNFR